MAQNDKTYFYFGIAVGIAVISTVGFFTMLIAGGSGISMPSFSTGDKNDNNEVSVSVSVPKFEACLDDQSIADKVESDLNEGASLGVRGTPGTFIGGYLIPGALPFEALSPVIDDILAGKEPTSQYLEDENGKITKVDVPAIRGNEAVKGNPDAELQIIEYSDFECPYCNRFQSTLEQIEKVYGDKVAIVYRHFPLPFHQSSKSAAIASECAAQQGEFWEMHDKLFELQTEKNMNRDAYINAAKDLGLE